MSLELEKMKKFKISIILAVVDEEETIEKCLNSLLNQTMWRKCDFEIIVVNDGGNKKIRKILEKYPVKIISSPSHLGAIKARNLGFKHSTGDYIFQAEADAFYSPNYVELCLSHLIRDPNVGSVYGYLHQWPSSSPFYKYWEELRKLTQINYEPFSGWFFRRKDIEKVMEKFGRQQMYNEEVLLCEDLRLAEEIKKLGYKLAFEEKAEWWHRYPDSLKLIFKKGFQLGVSSFLKLKSPYISIYKQLIIRILLIFLLGIFLVALGFLHWIFPLIILITGYFGLFFLPIKAIKKKNQSLSCFKNFIFFYPIVYIVRYIGITFGFLFTPFFLLIGKRPSHY